ncbi:MAG: sigma-70 family RNA polymerase sigma factor [Candidatus Omnitrophica bacterium]|nr:sigma-70 family RNA polymerase sigma factor [Candidatus Omnitrophota bacterium]MBI2104382.1 sigma-70 family RNA polymerase sigma factor [Candidatus Omnitrophota bacterium]
MPSGQTDEQQLIGRLKAKDESALDLLMAAYGGKVYGLSLRLTSNHHDAEEVCQDVFLAVFEKIDGFRGDAKLSSWVYRITANAALMKLRKRPKIKALPLEEELGPAMTEEGMIAEPVVDWSRLPSDELERKELTARLAQAVELLPPEYRAVFVLRDIEGLPAEEASQVLEISVAALKSRLHRARLFLRKQLADYVVVTR